MRRLETATGSQAVSPDSLPTAARSKCGARRAPLTISLRSPLGRGCKWTTASFPPAVPSPNAPASSLRRFRPSQEREPHGANNGSANSPRDAGAASDGRSAALQLACPMRNAVGRDAVLSVFRPLFVIREAPSRTGSNRCARARMPLVRATLPEDCFRSSRAKCDARRSPIEQVARFDLDRQPGTPA
jgi:hypothetical protein